MIPERSETLFTMLKTTPEQKTIIANEITNELSDKNVYDFQIENELSHCDENYTKPLQDLVSTLSEEYNEQQSLQIIKWLAKYDDNFDSLKQRILYITEYLTIPLVWKEWLDNWYAHIDAIFFYEWKTTKESRETVWISSLREEITVHWCSRKAIISICEWAETYWLEIEDYNTFSTITYCWNYYNKENIYEIDYVLSRLLSLPWSHENRILIEEIKKSFPDPLLREILIRTEQEILLQWWTSTEKIASMAQFSTLRLLFREQIDLSSMMSFYLKQCELLVRDWKDEESIIQNLLDYLWPIKRDYEEFDTLIDTLQAMKDVFNDKKKQWRSRLKNSYIVGKSKDEIDIDDLWKYQEILQSNKSNAWPKNTWNSYDFEADIRYKVMEIRKAKFLIDTWIMCSSEEQSLIETTDILIKNIKTFFSDLQVEVIQWKSLATAIVKTLWHIKDAQVLKNKEFERFVNYNNEVLPSFKQRNMSSIYELLEYWFDTDIYMNWHTSPVHSIISAWITILNVEKHQESIKNCIFIEKYDPTFSDKIGKVHRSEVEEWLRKDIWYYCAEHNDIWIFDSSVKKVSSYTIRDTLFQVAFSLWNKEFIKNLIAEWYERHKHEKFIVSLFSDEWIDFLEEYFIIWAKEITEWVNNVMYCTISMPESVKKKIQWSYDDSWKNSLDKLIDWSDLRRENENSFLYNNHLFLQTISKNTFNKETAKKIIVFMYWIDFYKDVLYRKDWELSEAYSYEYFINPIVSVALWWNKYLFSSLLKVVEDSKLTNTINFFEIKKNIPKLWNALPPYRDETIKNRSIVHIIAENKEKESVNHMMASLISFINTVDENRLFSRYELSDIENNIYKNRSLWTVEENRLREKLKFFLNYQYKWINNKHNDDWITALQLLAAKWHLVVVAALMKHCRIDIWWWREPISVMNDIVYNWCSIEAYDRFLDNLLLLENQKVNKILPLIFTEFDIWLPSWDYLQREQFHFKTPDRVIEHFYNIKTHKQYSAYNNKSLMFGTDKMNSTYVALHEESTTYLLPSNKNVSNVVWNNWFMIENWITYRAEMEWYETPKGFDYPYFLYKDNKHLKEIIKAENIPVLKHIISINKVMLSDWLFKFISREIYNKYKKKCVESDWEHWMEAMKEEEYWREEDMYISVFIDKYLQDWLIDKSGLERIIYHYLSPFYSWKKDSAAYVATILLQAMDESCDFSNVCEESRSNDPEGITIVLKRIDTEIKPILDSDLYERLFWWFAYT